MPHKRQCGIAQRLLQAPLSALGQVNMRGSQGLLPAPQLANDGSAVAVIIEFE